jgi:hypothetical protein
MVVVVAAAGQPVQLSVVSVVPAATQRLHQGVVPLGLTLGNAQCMLQCSSCTAGGDNPVVAAGVLYTSGHGGKMWGLSCAVTVALLVVILNLAQPLLCRVGPTLFKAGVYAVWLQFIALLLAELDRW